MARSVTEPAEFLIADMRYNCRRNTLSNTIVPVESLAK
jgi:hypothetical protein